MYGPKPQIDTSKPHPARVYDYLLGGKDHYVVDREVGERMPSFFHQGARENRAFMHRALAWTAREGIDQFLDIGTGIPTEPNLHQIVQNVHPAARIMYTDNDPIVLRHAEALLVGTPEGATDYLHADVRDPKNIIERAQAFLDFSRPVALSLIAIMHFVLDDQDPYGIVRTLTSALPSGSYLVLSHGTFDLHPEDELRVREFYGTKIPLRLRSRSEVEPFFDGLELVEPGLVIGSDWHGDATASGQIGGVYAGVARTP